MRSGRYYAEPTPRADAGPALFHAWEPGIEEIAELFDENGGPKVRSRPARITEQCLQQSSKQSTNWGLEIGSRLPVLVKAILDALRSVADTLGARSTFQ